MKKPQLKSSRRAGKPSSQIPRYADLASLAGAAGKLPEPRSWAEMIEMAHEDAWKKKQAWDNWIKILDDNDAGGEPFTEQEVEADEHTATE